MLPYARFPAFGRPGSGPWRRVLRTIYKIHICNVSIFQHCASARDFCDFNCDFVYGDVISKPNCTIPRNRPRSLQMHCGSRPAPPSGPQMLLESSQMHLEMTRNSSFLPPGHRSHIDISTRNHIRTAISGSMGCHSPHSTF